MTVPSARSISVVVPTHQRRESVLRLLGALAAQDVGESALEVVVAADRSTDGTLEAVSGFGAGYTVIGIGSGGRGRAQACNAGVAAASGDVVLFLDDDMEPCPSCVRRHLDHHRGDALVCVLGAVPVRVDGSSSYTERYVAQRFDAHLAKLGAQRRTTALRDFYSGNASIRRDVLEEVGLFDEAFTMYGNEDLELAFRLRAAGVEVRYEPRAVAYQRYTKGFDAWAADTLAKGRTAVQLAQTHPETFPELQLSQFEAHSRRWRALRALVLGLARRFPRSVPTGVRIAGAAERSGLGRRRVFYAFAVDSLYWIGVMRALDRATRDPRLERLRQDLRVGPIRLLLHG
jgi:GT2 family glycosyltransferase